MTSVRSVYRLFATALAAALFFVLGTGCRHDVVNEQGETVSAVITPLQIGPLLWPVGEEDVTTYGISTGLATYDRDSCGIFASILGSGFTGTNYGVSAGLAFVVGGRESSFNGISAGLLYLSDFLGYSPGSGTQNGISVFPFMIKSKTNGLSVEAMTAKKRFNGIDFCLCNIYGTKGAGLQVIGLDCSGYNDSKITGCQIGGILTSAVRGAQIGAVTYNPKVYTGKSLEKSLNLGVMNLDLTEGFQVGAVNNTSEGNPVQIGLFNTTFDGSPFQVGLLNINPNGFLPIFPFFNYSVKKGACEREQESAAGF
jgi:hypothetical protein